MAKFNSTLGYDMPNLIREFHSLLFEQMVDLQILGRTSNDSSSPTNVRKTLQEEYFKLLRPLVELEGMSSYPHNGSGNYQSVFPGYINFGERNFTMSNYQMAENGIPDVVHGDANKVEDPCHLITDEESMSYQDIAFQLELIVQPIFICIGFIFNTVAINVLRR